MRTVECYCGAMKLEHVLCPTCKGKPVMCPCGTIKPEGVLCHGCNGEWKRVEATTYPRFTLSM